MPIQPQHPPPEKLALPGVRHVLAVASGKGGVGKSTVAVNLALALAEQGRAVGLMDADLYGPNIPRMLGIDARPLIRGNRIIPLVQYGLRVLSIGFLLPARDSPVIWRGPLVAKTLEQFFTETDWEGLDYLVVDLPPGTGDAQLTLAQRVSVSGAVIVTTPQEVALEDAVKGVRMFQQVDVPILGILENMSYFLCPHCGERTNIFRSEGGSRISEELGVPFLGRLPLDPQVCQGGDKGRPFLLDHPDAPAAVVFRSLARAVRELCEPSEEVLEREGMEPSQP
jgi:ATP-binding protein involved in chromosome partitioning